MVSIAQPGKNGNSDFLMIPKALVLDSEMSDSAIRVYAILKNADFGRPIHMSLAKVAEHLGKTKHTARRAIEELETKGWVASDRRDGSGRASKYTLCKNASSSASDSGPSQKCYGSPSKIARAITRSGSLDSFSTAPAPQSHQHQTAAQARAAAYYDRIEMMCGDAA
ncbi:MAG TPA: helix-turn-helix domain-containing protein [Candidatus Baltobacteraceae bacterium]